MSMLLRLRVLLSGLWAGMLLTIGGMAAPTLFTLLERASAGRVAQRYFFLESRASLVLVAALILIERMLARRAMQQSLEAGARAAASSSLLSINLGLLLLALGCTIVGYDVLQPMMEVARAGGGGASFAALHGFSAGLFLLKTVLVLVLAWRASSRT